MMHVNGLLDQPEPFVADTDILVPDRHGRSDGGRATTSGQLIKKCFQRLKEFHRIATRYDKPDTSFAAAVHLVAAFLAQR